MTQRCPLKKMNLVKVTGHLEKMNAALIACFEGGYFHPELLSEKSGGHDAYHPYDAVNPYLPVLSKLGQIAKECGTDFAPEQTIGQDKIEQAANLLLGVGSRHPALPLRQDAHRPGGRLPPEERQAVHLP